MLIELSIVLFSIIIYAFLTNYVSYGIKKDRILKERKWDLNICCGKTDGGGINVDIVQHQDLPRFKLVDSIYDLPFEDAAFDSVLCSHTIEHVEDPARFYQELQRVGKSVTLVVPPLYDIAAVFNIFEHKWIFLTFTKKHQTLPRYVRLPFASTLHSLIGQRNKG